MSETLAAVRTESGKNVSTLCMIVSADPPDRDLTDADVRTITLPPDATVQIGDVTIFIPRGETRLVGPCGGGYELVDWAHAPTPRRQHLRDWMHRHVCQPNG